MVFLKNKVQRQEWWKTLSVEEQGDYINGRQKKKTEQRRKKSIELTRGSDFTCRTCFHRKTGSCNDNLPNGCEYWYDPANKKQGLAYKKSEKPLTKKQRRKQYSDELWRQHLAKQDRCLKRTKLTS